MMIETAIPDRPEPGIAIRYFSGAGGTRLVAELLAELLSAELECRVLSIHDPVAVESLRESDLLVLCYPTYFLRPAPSMREFVEALGPFDPPRRAYLVSTYELYSENSIRACAIALKERGVSVMGAAVVRSPGSDATCVLPAWLCPWLYRFERKLPRKLKSIASEIRALALSNDRAGFIPRRKWYTPFAQALQILAFNGFDKWREKIRVLPERCALCGACVSACDREAWRMSGSILSHLPERCELCTRCMHRCPRRAIVLIDGLKDNRRLDARLYASLKAMAREQLRLG